jgi:hypothetical protein
VSEQSEEDALLQQEVADRLAKDRAEWKANHEGWHVTLTKVWLGYTWTAYEDGMPRRWGWRLLATNAEYAGRSAIFGYKQAQARRIHRMKWNRDTRV